MDEPAPQPAPSPAPPARFCGTCGTPLTDVAQCARCARDGPRGPGGSLLNAAVQSVKSPTLRAALAMYFALLACSAILLIVLLTSGRHDAAFSVHADLAATLGMGLVTAVGCLLCWQPVRPALATRPARGWFAGATAMGVGTFALALGAIAIMRAIGVEAIDYASDIREAGYGFPFALLLIAVLPAVIEEVAFRGVIVGALLRVLTPAESVVVSAFMFMILHLSIVSLPHLLAIGLVLGWLRVRTGSLWPGVLLHFTHNTLVLLMDWQGWSL